MLQYSGSSKIPAPHSHVTCICYVFKQSSTCCVDGFYNLLDRTPQLSILFQNKAPNKNGLHTLRGMQDGEVKISRETSESIQFQCVRIIQNFAYLTNIGTYDVQPLQIVYIDNMQ